MRAKLAFSAMVAGAAVATAMAAPAYADDTDSIFIKVLDDKGISYPSASDAITLAKGVCVHLTEGNSLARSRRRPDSVSNQRASSWVRRPRRIARIKALAD